MHARRPDGGARRNKKRKRESGTGESEGENAFTLPLSPIAHVQLHFFKVLPFSFPVPVIGALSLAFAAENIKNLPLSPRAREKISAERLVGKSKDSHMAQGFRDKTTKFSRLRLELKENQTKYWDMARKPREWTILFQFFLLTYKLSHRSCFPFVPRPSFWSDNNLGTATHSHFCF